MRILFASEYYPPWAPGGGEWTNQAWAEALARAGHRVVVMTLNYGARVRETSAGGVVVIRAPFWPRAGSEEREAGAKVRRRLGPIFDMYFARQISRAARAEDVEVIHAQSKGALIPALRAGRQLGLPVLITIRDVGLLCPLGFCTIFEPWKTFDCSRTQYLTKCAPYFEAINKRPTALVRLAKRRLSLRWAWWQHLKRRAALARVDGVVGLSAGILDLYPESVVPRSRRCVVHSLPPLAPEPTPAEAARVRKELRLGHGPLVLYAGRFSHGKGKDVFIKALDSVRTAVPGVTFVIAGPTDNVSPPADLDIRTVGSLPHSVLFPLYRAADVVVVPSIWPEPLSRVIVEAMTFGRPVVATAVGGSPEMVRDGVTGLLVPRGDPVALGGAIIELLGDPARRERMGAAARARAAEIFDEDKVVGALLDAYAMAGRSRA